MLWLGELLDQTDDGAELLQRVPGLQLGTLNDVNDDFRLVGLAVPIVHSSCASKSAACSSIISRVTRGFSIFALP